MFRSRLEARWAVFFDELDVEWEYEPERYQLRSGEIYIPDFRVRFAPVLDDKRAPSEHFSCFVEVKPRGGDFRKACLLAELLNHTGEAEHLVWLAHGAPHDGPHYFAGSEELNAAAGWTSWGFPRTDRGASSVMWVDTHGEWGPRLGLDYRGSGPLEDPIWPDAIRYVPTPSRWLSRAASRAKSERFGA